MMGASFELDNLKWILDRTTDAVKTADNKNSIVAAILAGLAAVAFADGSLSSAAAVIKNNATDHAVCLVLMVLMALSFTVAMVALIASLFPRTKCGYDSAIYYSLIAEHKDWISLKRKLADGYSLEDDLLCQIYANSTICKKKMFWHSVALFSTYMLVLWTVAFAVCFMIGG